MNTQEKIDQLLNDANSLELFKVVCKNMSEMLKEKNKLYGDSALNPTKIFSKLDVENSILVRLDDKIMRIMNAKEIRKNDITDLMGYLTLYMISKDWLDFKDQID